MPTVSVADLPDSIDWRLRGYVTEVKDQVRIENCIHVLIKVLHTHNTYTYRRRWLLSACACKIEQQGNMRLIKKNMRLTASVRLIDRA